MKTDDLDQRIVELWDELKLPNRINICEHSILKKFILEEKEELEKAFSFEQKQREQASEHWENKYVKLWKENRELREALGKIIRDLPDGYMKYSTIKFLEKHNQPASASKEAEEGRNEKNSKK